MNRRQERFIRTMMIAAFAGAFTLGASAQTSAPSEADVSKQKQEMVKGATAGTAKGYSGAAADGAAAAAKTRDMPKVLPDTAAKQKAVDSLTATTVGKGSGQMDAEASARAAADKSPRKAKPRMSDYEKELHKASTP
jgi:hypothetical protein